MDVVDIFKTTVSMCHILFSNSNDNNYLLVNRELYKKAKEAVKSGEKGFEKKGKKCIS